MHDRAPDIAAAANLRWAFQSVRKSLLIVAFLLSYSAIAARDLPGEVGTVWHYQVKVKWTVRNSNKVRSADIDWETSVVAAGSAGRVKAMVLSGFPTDLCWYEPGTRPGLSVLTLGPEGLFLAWLSNPTSPEELLDRAINNPTMGQHLLLAQPRLGDCLDGDPERTDRRYCWHVEREIRGQGKRGWAVAYRTIPDHEIIEIVPGIGVTGFIFEHHGTVSSVRARLVKLEKRL